MKKTIKFVGITLAAIMLLVLTMGLAACDNDKGGDNESAAAGAVTDTGTADALDKLTDKINDLSLKLDELWKKADDAGEQPDDEQAEALIAFDYGDECYEKIKYIDKVLKDRDCYGGANYKLAEKWILWNLYEAGYTAEEAFVSPFTVTKYFKEEGLKTTLSAVASYEIADENHYAKSGRNYNISENGEYVKVNVTMNNIVAVKKGESDEQIIVGAHFDGDGTGDNGSGIALNLTTAEHFYGVDTYYTIVFIFFNAEEIGCYGSTAYAEAMSEEDIAKTKYMINMDSLVCGDYCNLYGGVQDDETKTVSATEAYDNAVKVAESIGIEFKTNPWTYDNPAPGYEVPDYASPSTGDWSDHKGFKNVGIKYLYFEATNWEIPGPYAEYDGYGETYLIGMLMNTKNDYLEYIETYFPGRVLSHIKKFSALLNALLMQSELDF